jgi:osmotically-inducible protein OsmY
MRKEQHKLAVALVAISLALGSTSIGAEQEGQYGRAAERERQFSPTDQLKASQIIGKSVSNAQNEDLGRVTDLIVDLNAGSVPCAILAHGGTLGMGRTKTAVPISALQYSADGRTLMMSATKEQLQTASKIATGAWSSVADAEWTKSVDAFYGQPASFAQGRFERQPLLGTPEQRQFVREPQKGAELLTKQTADAELTQRINSTLQQELGVEAFQKLQITAAEGTVTLKGEVASEAEKQNIENKIKAVAGVQKVENQLTVKQQ